MASSKVGIASSPPFGCALRDHGRRNGCMDTHTTAAHAALHNFVRDHLNNCITNCDQNNLANFRMQNEDKNPRKSPVVDGWHTQQVNGEEQQEAADSPDLSYSSMAPSSETCAADISTLAASSLVQIWEQRLTTPSSNKMNSGSPPSSRSSSGSSNHENANSAQDEKRESEADETDRTGQPQPPQQSDREVSSSQSKTTLANSNAGERLRVVDIIKRLSAASEENNLEQSCSDKNGSSVLEHHAEHRLMVISSPRLRGRQAFNDLLMMMERDRHGELHALEERAPVSKFTQRGRIQSLLRLRLLQRGVAAYDPPYLEQARASEVRRQPKGSSSISHLRKRFNHIGNDHGIKRSSSEKTTKNTAQSNRRADIAQESVSCRRGFHAKIETTSTSGSKNVETQKAKEMVEPTKSMDGCNACETSPDWKARKDDTNLGSQNTSEPTPSMEDQKVNATGLESDASVGISFESKDLNSQENAKVTLSMDGCDYIHVVGQESETCSLHYDEMTEEIYESYQYDQHETSNDWIADIARPRSYWENMRQEWYMEMLSSGLDNKQDIRWLIERRTVSSFLSSDFRERMDKLMASHLGRQSNLMKNEEDEENSEFELMEFLREHSNPAGSHQERHEIEDDLEKEQKQQEDVSMTSSQYPHQVSDDFDLSPSSWSFRDNYTATDDSDRGASASSPHRSQTLCDESLQNSSCNNNNAVVMELICDLRGQIQQLHEEMAELRKKIKGCNDMQVSKNQEIHSAFGEVQKPCDIPMKKGNCSVCREEKADTVFYRCGHMCACLKCANELQCSSGKCPICRAAIVDVVRVYVDI